MRVVFMGSPELAVASLDAIHASTHDILAVVTQPGRPAGRGRRVRPSPVARRAAELGLDMLEPPRLDGDVIDRLSALRPDVLAVVAYGKLLRPKLLELAPHGAINVHPSLLPRHRGASPIQSTILAGDIETGVVTMRLDEGLDTGPLLLVEKTPIGDAEDAEELSGRLAAIGGRLLVETLDRLEVGDLVAIPQSDNGVTYAAKLSSDDAWLDWSAPAADLALRVRGLKPWPIAQTKTRDGQRLKILRAQAIGREVNSEVAIGTVVAASKTGVDVACSAGVLRLLEAQLEGSRAMAAQDLVNGRRIATGDRLGS